MTHGTVATLSGRSTMTKRPASYSKFRIQRQHTRRQSGQQIHGTVDALRHTPHTKVHAPAGKTSMQIPTSETSVEERGRHARMREDVRDRYTSLKTRLSAKGTAIAKDAIHQESQVGLAGSHYSHLSQVCHPAHRKVSWP